MKFCNSHTLINSNFKFAKLLFSYLICFYFLDPQKLKVESISACRFTGRY